MNNPIYNLLTTTNRGFVITSTIIAMMISMIWFNPKVFAIVVWLIFIFSTQLSQISGSMVDRRVLWLITGSSLLSSLIATVLWFTVFN